MNIRQCYGKEYKDKAIREQLKWAAGKRVAWEVTCKEVKGDNIVDKRHLKKNTRVPWCVWIMLWLRKCWRVVNDTEFLGRYQGSYHLPVICVDMFDEYDLNTWREGERWKTANPIKCNRRPRINPNKYGDPFVFKVRTRQGTDKLI